ncbi:MAG TPA: mechanosensitive ion channel domain-containing protein [Edaphocola sp.]|nr:mechanosensitive ion channel domain-containing protein [Edaphocola sp.]
MNKFGGPLAQALFYRKVFRAILNFIPMMFCYFIIEEFFYRSKKFLPYVDMFFNWLILSVVAQILVRTTKAIEDFAQSNTGDYNPTGFRAIGQSIRIVGTFLYIVISLSIFLKVSPGSIFAGLGAFTAVIILVFRDSILGFISGIHVVGSRHFKVGDWIHVSKYKLEGTVVEINLLTTKIKNFDNTISTIPTYDLINTEVRNAQILIDRNSRRIKRSVYFNTNSFKFVDYDLYLKLQKIDLLKGYFKTVKTEIQRLEQLHIHQGDTNLINGKQLTNIGVFRMYVLAYLQQHDKIDPNQEIMVRQLEITPQGMPLEIYCFTRLGVWGDFENLQSDIFDHILVASRAFDLEIAQMGASRPEAH